MIRRARPSRQDIAVLVAMLTRRTAVVRKPSGAWWVPGWNAPDITAGRIGRLEVAGMLSSGSCAGVRVLTDAGREAALAACTPSTRERLAA